MRPDSSILLVRLLCAAALVFAAQSVSSVPPVNDRCGGAIAIPAAGPFPHLTAPVDITEANLVNDPAAPSCGFELARSVWYVFRPANTDVYRFSTCGESGAATTVRDTVMAIYTNALANVCGQPYFEIDNGCNDDACNKQSEITTMLRAGVSYYILLWQYGTNALAPGNGQMQLLVTRGKPANDDCSNPQPVQLNVPVLGRTVFARNDYDFGNSVCFSGIGHTPVDTPGLEVVFSFTAPSADTYSFKVKNYNLAAEPDYDLVVYVSPTCPMPNPGGTMNDCLGAANRNLSIAEEVTCLPLTNSQQVYVFVDDRYSVNLGSTFTLEITRCASEIETNDFLSIAQPYLFESTGSILPINETDAYALGKFPAGSRVFALIDAISARVPDFNLWVVSFTDTLEYDTDNNDVPYGQGSGSVAGTPLPEECAWLRVRHVSGIAEPYRLYAVVQPPSSSATPESEPNNLPAQAQSSAANYFFGSLPTMSDEDLYAFDAVAGDLIHIGLDSDPLRDRTPIDAQLELLGSAGSILMLVDDPNATSNTNTIPGSVEAPRPYSPSETILCRAAYTGRYYARVLISSFAQPPTTAGDYLLSITRNGFIGAAATNHPPRIIDLAAPPVAQSSSTVLSATIIDPDAGPAFSMFVNWGDGSSNALSAIEVCQYAFQATHQYAQAGSYAASITVRDVHGGTFSTNTTIQVINSAPATIKAITYGLDGTVQLDLEGSPGATYRIEISETLQGWTTLATRTADSAGRFQLLDVPPLPQRRFYRAVWP